MVMTTDENDGDGVDEDEDVNDQNKVVDEKEEDAMVMMRMVLIIKMPEIPPLACTFIAWASPK